MVKNLFLNASPVVGSTIHTSLLAWPVTCVVSLCISTGKTARQCLKSKENEFEQEICVHEVSFFFSIGDEILLIIKGTTKTTPIKRESIKAFFPPLS